MDVMRWSTQKAIYPPFVPLRSFKKANSLKADQERGREREGGRVREIYRPSSPSTLHQVDQAD